jgi:hypothetical protein
MSFSGAVLRRPDEKAAAAMERYAWRGDAGGGAASETPSGNDAA